MVRDRDYSGSFFNRAVLVPISAALVANRRLSFVVSTEFSAMSGILASRHEKARKPAESLGFRAFEVVAGAGFEPATFRL
mgnify:CR=1 FL=1